ncbi:metallophosphoesterase [bacterium]|nr:metallophosphoesterase [bacterium]
MKRRAFLIGNTLTIASATTMLPSASLVEDKAPLSVGLITDLHYADKPSRGSRHYRESLQKIEEASEAFRTQHIDFAVELGDLIDAADSVETEKRYLKTINKKFERICDQRHYVLGNHCVDTLKKEEFLGEVGQTQSYYSFDQSGYHFVILDACFRSDDVGYERRNFQWTDANLSQKEIEWLEADLTQTKLPTIIFIHQRLDVDNNHGVKNNAAVRKILENSQQVLAVFQGHSHQNDIKWVSGIPYCTCVAMVEGNGVAENGYSILDLYPDGTLQLKGFRKQDSHQWAKNRSNTNRG